MLVRRLLLLLVTLLLVSACGYRLGGFKNVAMKKYSTFSINMFENRTMYPNVSMQLSTALADQMQRDGTYRIASPEECDFVLEGVVTSVTASSLRPNPEDTYLSSEIGLVMHVTYSVRDNHTGKEVIKNMVTADTSYFNESGNVQTARDSALSYAARKAAEQIVEFLTIP